MDWLNKILEGMPEAERISAEIKTQLPKFFIPKDKYNELSEAKRALEEKADVKFSDALKNAVIEAVLSSKMSELKTKDSAILKMLIDRDKITVGENGGISGLSEQLEAIVKEKPFLFGADSLQGRTPVDVPGSKNEITKEQFAKMSYKQRSELYKTNPELYNQLK